MGRLRRVLTVLMVLTVGINPLMVGTILLTVGRTVLIVGTTVLTVGKTVLTVGTTLLTVGTELTGGYTGYLGNTPEYEVSQGSAKASASASRFTTWVTGPY